MTKKIFISLLVTLGGLFFISSKALAVCPVCTVAVGAGVGFSRWLGIDDTITGLWIGGSIVSLIIWTMNWLEKKQIIFIGIGFIITLGYYLLIVLPLCYSEIIGHPYNTIWGLDKLLIGIASGSFFFFLGAWSYNLIKEKNGKAQFPFQKVVMPVAPLIIFSVIFYFITK